MGRWVIWLFTLGATGAFAQLPVPAAPWTDERGLQGTLLTTDHAATHGFAVFIDKEGCEEAAEWRVEIQQPRIHQGDGSAMAELQLLGAEGGSLTVPIVQRETGRALLISDFCVTPAWLPQARVTLWYGGYSRLSNVFITDFPRWASQ